jgi:hypothetical protein
MQPPAQILDPVLWNYRFKLDGKEYSGTTALAATKQNTRAAQDKESEHRQDLLEPGVRPKWAFFQNLILKPLFKFLFGPI